MDIEPKEVFGFFEEICKIPRGSGNEKAISDYIVKFAAKLGLWVNQDKSFNIIIKKPGTPGYENAPTVIIQGHLDMVCVNEGANSGHDFSKRPIDVYVDGDFIRARDTSLGADNGIAVAMGMALLASGGEIPHPPLEVVFTTDEETGMTGAANIDGSLLSGRIFINLDSEEEGFFCASCAGGVKAAYRLPLKYMPSPPNHTPFKVKISGLNGGHSGIQINEGLANANYLMGRALYRWSKNFELYVSDINGGSKDNAIPAYSECVLFISDNDSEAFKKAVKELEEIYKAEYMVSDACLSMSLETVESKPPQVFTRDLTDNLTASLTLIPNGVQSMCGGKRDLVESSNNIGVVRIEGDAIEIVCALRSSVESRKHAILEKMESIAQLTGAALFTRGDYPNWEYSINSGIRKLFMNTYEELYGKKAVEYAVHAGLECGWFKKILPGADFVSLGPDLFFVHSIKERLSISSTARTWKLLKTVLARIC